MPTVDVWYAYIVESLSVGNSCLELFISALVNAQYLQILCLHCLDMLNVGMNNC